MFYHVRIEFQEKREHDECKVDMDLDTLERKVLVPYRSGGPIVLSGRTIQAREIKRVRISRSDEPARSFYAAIKADDDRSSVTVLGGPSMEWRAAARAEDVTDEMIEGPPGGESATSSSRITNGRSLGSSGDGASVFIVHGSDTARAERVARLVEAIIGGDDVVILHEQPSHGRTLLEKFEQNAAGAGFAVVILTADDEGCAAGSGAVRGRARQNVVFELGFFFGRLGRGRTAVLHAGEIEFPSDMNGLAYIRMDDGGGWKNTLARELKDAGFPVDFERIK